MTYVFRNNTIERFLPGNYMFSGYDDFTEVPDADDYLWWYQVPFNYNNEKLALEVNSYSQKLNYIVDKIEGKSLVVISLEIWYNVNSNESDWSVKIAVEHFNQSIREISNIKSNVKVLDIHEFTHRYPMSELIDWKYYFISQMPINPRLSREFQLWFDDKMRSMALKRKKCLVLDLDNTLWYGILGEDGVNGIQLSGYYPGKAFHYWQEGLKELLNNGVILTICSKNNEQDILELWRTRTDMVLKESDFSCKRINWNDKATNIQEIAKELNIGLDSLVFIDDNPTERELVRSMLPMVETPEWPANPYELPLFYQSLVNKYFRVYSVTDEDKKKHEQYRQNANRNQEMLKFSRMEDFLRSLEMKLTIEMVNPASLQRVAQMTQKTNQFNLTTKRYTEADIKKLMDNGEMIYTLAVADKFGDSGITGCIILCKTELGWNIDTLLLSCRILGKGIERAFVKYVLAQFDDSIVTAEYIPTDKNSQVCSFYDNLGFEVCSEKDGRKCYKVRTNMLNLWIEDYYSIN